jgi:ribonuclease BN (tRNA processing enzyme)
VRLTTIGTGTAAPSPSRVCSAQLIETGDVRLLLDCGSGAVHRMAQLGIDWMGITHLALTHFHADHTTDLATLLFAWRYGAIPWREAPITLVGPPGTVDTVARIDAAFGGKFGTLGFAIEVREAAEAEIVDLGGGIHLSSRKVPHTPESVAYSITSDSVRVVYTGDTGPDTALGEWAAGCDLLLAECSLPESMKMATHLTPEDCGDLAHAAGAGTLVLTHFYPPVEAVDIRGIVAERHAGPVVLATDGWSTVIEDR